MIRYRLFFCSKANFTKRKNRGKLLPVFLSAAKQQISCQNTDQYQHHCPESIFKEHCNQHPDRHKKQRKSRNTFHLCPRFKHFLYFQFMQAFCSYACPFLSASASLSISFTSFSVTVFSPLELKRSITSGTISRIFVIVS